MFRLYQVRDVNTLDFGYYLTIHVVVLAINGQISMLSKLLHNYVFDATVSVLIF